MKWKRIDDDLIRHCWVCPNKDCGNNEKGCSVHPSFYESSGNPFCPDCEDDMVYVCTEMQVEDDGTKV